MKNIFLISIISILLVGCNKHHESVNNIAADSTVQQDIQMIRNGLENYVLSITNADSVVGGHLFSRDPEFSFIHPRGRDTSWTQINSSIYRFFREKFDSRDLKFYDERISIYDHTGWVEFNWIFNATLKGDTAQIQTRGRETQIWRKNDSGWHIIHIHYSAMPDTQ